MNLYTDPSKPYCVLFAGVPGTSKTPISHYLSCRFNLPILNTDQIRYEVREDLLADNINRPDALKEFEARRDARLVKLLSENDSFILDGSMDRRWAEVKEKLEAAKYSWFMINMELTRPFLIKLYDATGRSDFVANQLNGYLKQHGDFTKKFSQDLSLEIGDSNFANRLEVAARGLEDWLAP